MSNNNWGADVPNRSNRIENDDVPKHRKKAPKKKPFGIEYFRGYSLGGWTSHSWYATAKARDQAYDNLIIKTANIMADVRKVDR